ncbi:MAG: FAD:protein FMN transferase [Bacteroidales bacterium]|jgi:thiamine biosynthesis lipoprotein|nr:FAD:protein FMN transferase [Bacteroidales bacterium]
MKTFKTTAVWCVIAGAILFSCTSGEAVFSSFNGFAQGTTYSIIYENDGSYPPEKMKENVEKILRNFDLSLSLYEDSSILSAVNRNQKPVLDTFFTEVFIRSKEISLITGGAFDVTVGPLVKALGFGPDSQRNVSPAFRDSLLQLVGMDKVAIRNGEVLKTNDRIELDFNAIAQGYSVDVIAGYFDRLNIRNYLVEIGGEVRTRGTRNREEWKIGIDRPEENNFIPGNDLQAIIRLSDRSLATSGNYRKFYVEDGVKYSHTIDPVTGLSARNTLLSATIIAGDCATADGIATACMVMGREKCVEFLAKHPEFDAFLVYSDEKGNFRTWTTEKFKKNISEN